MEPTQENLERAVAQTEVTLGALRESALELLINEDTPSVTVSQAERTASGLEITSSREGDDALTRMIVNGEYDWNTRLWDHQLEGDFSITHVNGQEVSVENASFQMLMKHLDFNFPENAHISWSRTTQDGTPLSSYQAADSEVQRGQYDNNGQPVRLAHLIGDKVNSRRRYAHAGDHAMDTELILTDPDLGTLSYNETRDKTAAGISRRSVVRDMQGNVLAIVQQSYNLDDKGDLTDVRTSARRPRNFRKPS